MVHLRANQVARGPDPGLCLDKPLCMLILSCIIVMLAKIAIWSKLLMHRSFASYFNTPDFRSGSIGLRGGR
jgi:hypothetical protein